MSKKKKQQKVNKSKYIPEKYKDIYNKDYSELVGDLEEENVKIKNSLQLLDTTKKRIVERVFNNLGINPNYS